MAISACLTSLIFLILSLFLRKKSKTISPVIFFFALWLFILFLSVLNLYDIYKPTDEAYILIMLMLTFFYLGTFINMIIKNSSRMKLKSETKDTENIIKLSSKIFYILSFAIILFNIIDLVIILKEATSGTPMWQIRNWTLEPYGSNNPILSRRSFIEDAFRSIILAPFTTIIHPITAYYFFYSKDSKQRYKLLLISLIILITSSLAGGGGRLGFIYYLGCFILAFFIKDNNREMVKDIVKKYKKTIILIFIFAILSVSIYTTIRTGARNLIKQTYTYFALPPTLLSEWLPEIENMEYTYGMTTFFGLHSYFFRTLDTIGFDFLVPQIYNDAYTNIINAEKFKNVGYGIGNAFVTPIYYFLLDGGYPFVCIASFFFGYIASNLYEKFEKNINVRSFTIYVLVMYGIFITFMRIQTAIPSYIISFILTYFILRISKQEEILRLGEN